MKITVRIGDVEVVVHEPTEDTQYPRMTTKDAYNEEATKSDRFLQFVGEVVAMTVIAYQDIHVYQPPPVDN